ncbi:hypothetical protein [Stenotrophomonas sp. SPM]|uniref:hypothetical protein n=1 Tax=Stenotrophomonas sp. SPM TaxID=2170735 RepID=UPI0010577FA4|nr:hypothetical protein [Stenotrophomonas sp. SPM]
MRAVDIDDPKAVRSARRRVIRMVLIAHFGADLREHSHWEAMLDSIEATLEQDDRHLAQFKALLAQLQRQS